MLHPKQTKFRKQHKMRNKNFAFRGNKLHFGNCGLQSVSRGYMTSRQIESARRVVSRYLKRDGQVWIRVFPDKPITKKPLEVRMGKGKGNVEYWVAQIKPGKILYEIAGVSKELARTALYKASSKLPVLTTFIEKW